MQTMNEKKVYCLLVSLLTLGTAISGFWLFQLSRIATNTSPLSFSVPFNNEHVALRVITGVHYSIDDDAEWDTILPATGHRVHIGEKQYTVTLFHQLKCLQIIRKEYMGPPKDPISPQTQHCMNYLRQTFLCHPNLRLESVGDRSGLAERGYDAVCRDWTKVYEEANRNQGAYVNLTQAGNVEKKYLV